MYIDISEFFRECDPFEFSHSRAEGGKDAMRETWTAALAEAAARPLLTTPNRLDALRAHIKNMGGWEREEIDAWDAIQCNAIFIQLVSGDIRSGGLDQAGYDFDSPEWLDYFKRAERGETSGNIVVDGTDKVLYYLGN